MILKNDLENLLKISFKLGVLCIESKTRIERPKFSIIKQIFGYFYSNENGRNANEEECITLIDFFNVLIERNCEDEEILEMIEKFFIIKNSNSNILMKKSMKSLFELMNQSDEKENFINQSHIISLLIIKNKYKLTQSLMEILNAPYNQTYTQIAIEFDSFDIVYLLKSMYPQGFTSKEKSYVPSLLLSFQRSNMFWLAKVHMLKSLIEYVNYSSAESFLMYLLKSLAKEEPQNNVMYYTPNILLLACNLIEVCRIIVSKYALLGRLTDKVEKILIDITSTYIQDIEDELQLRALAFEKDFEHRDSLDLLSKYNIHKIMNNKNMEQIALELWTSAFDVKGNILSTSSAYQICIYDSFNKPKDILTDYIFFNWENRSLSNFDHHLYQFQVWKTSMMAKFIVEGFFLTVLTVIFQYYLLDATNSANTVNSSFATYGNQTTKAAQATQYAVFTSNAYSYYTSMQVTIYLSYIALTYPLRIVLTIAFAIKSKRSFTFINMTYILDLLIFGVFIVRIYLEFNYYQSGLSSQTTNDTIGKAYYDNIFKYRNDQNLLSYLYTLGSSCLWLRIILLFRLTRFLGPLVKMIQNMITEIVIFMVLFSLQLIVFATMGNLLFTTVSQYNTFWEALGTLFASALGNFDLTILLDNDKSAILGIIYLVIFVILNNINE